MKRFIQYIIAWQIDIHWWFIMRYRKKGKRMIETGEPLTSPKLIELSRRIDQHGTRAFRLEDRYDALARRKS